MGNHLPYVFDITVSGGAGTSTKTITGASVAIGIKAPGTGAVYDIELTDSDGMGVAGRTNLVGHSFISIRTQFYGTHTIAITNATADGTYKVKVWFDD